MKRSTVVASWVVLVAIGAGMAATACSSSSSGAASASAGAGGSGGGAGAAGSGGAAPMGLGDYDPMPIGGTRPTKVYVPTGYNPSVPAPVVILLHGSGASGLIQEGIFKLVPQAEASGFLYAHPDGTPDQNDQRFWNATDACCDTFHTGVDDVAYLSGLITEIGTRWTIDPKRIYFVGHSNGGFMAYRMACDRADTVAAIGSLAGATWLDASKCAPSAPVAVVQIHGTADDTVLYAGGVTPGDPSPPYPGAEEDAADWAKYDGCAPTPTKAPAPFDLDAIKQPAGNTTIERYATGCHGDADVELWTIAGAGHIPSLSSAFAPQLVAFLLAHPKP